MREPHDRERKAKAYLHSPDHLNETMVVIASIASFILGMHYAEVAAFVGGIGAWGWHTFMFIWSDV